MKKVFFISLLTAFILGACEEPAQPTPLPPEPKPHINQFHCKINGKYWEVIPKNISQLNGQGNTIAAEFQIKDSILWISAINEKLEDRVILVLPYYLQKDTLTNTANIPYLLIKNSTCAYSYEIYKQERNEIVITFKDAKEQIIKGKFDYTAVSAVCKDTIRITEGYFDYSFK